MDSTQIKARALGLGAEVCGIANIERFTEAPRGFHPADLLNNAKSVIVVGSQFTKSVFASNSYCPHMHVREQLKAQIDSVTFRLSLEIEKNGFLAIPTPSSEPYEYWDEEKREGRGILSLKHSAVLAGLGCLGKNTLLINKDFGNRLWLGAVVTELELEPDEIAKNLCPKNCRICLDACPQKALDGITIIQKKCREICGAYTEGGGFYYACNICRKSCPHSRA